MIIAAEKAREAKKQKRQLVTDETINPESDMLSQLTILEDLSMINQTNETIGLETCYFGKNTMPLQIAMWQPILQVLQFLKTNTLILQRNNL